MAVAMAEYASAAAALASAEAELVRARRNLERTEIRLPYDGIVRSKDADIGQFVSTGTRLGVTFATDIAEVRLPLTDRDLAFCAGCPHRASYWVIKNALALDGREGFLLGDIGCYGMGAGRSGWFLNRTLHCMGSGAGVACGCEQCVRGEAETRCPG